MLSYEANLALTQILFDLTWWVIFYSKDIMLWLKNFLFSQLCFKIYHSMHLIQVISLISLINILECVNFFTFSLNSFQNKLLSDFLFPHL